MVSVESMYAKAGTTALTHGRDIPALAKKVTTTRYVSAMIRAFRALLVSQALLASTRAFLAFNSSISISIFSNGVIYCSM